MTPVTWDGLPVVVAKAVEDIIDVKDAFDSLLKRINDLEVTVENLRAQLATHDHPYKSPPVYGGRF